jgi:hypothetical protein
MRSPQAVTPIPPLVDAARRILTAVLAADPAVADSLMIAEALGALIDVQPPYPPLGLEDDPTEPDVGIPRAMRLLAQVIDETDALGDLCRYGETLVLLRRALAGLGGAATSTAP